MIFGVTKPVVFMETLTNKNVQVIPRQPEPPKLRPEGSYVIVGGQGGLGRAICLWMARHGAKSIVVPSPSGSSKPSTQHLSQKLSQVGTQLRAISCDISDKKQVESAFAACSRELPPVRGVIQAALILKVKSFGPRPSHEYNLTVLGFGV